VEAVEKDGLTWTQILNQEGQDECDVVKLFGITAFPTKVLINPEGQIIARYVGDVKEIDDKLKTLFP
jgi:hypothetical protein